MDSSDILINQTLTVNDTALIIGFGIECLMGILAFFANAILIVCLFHSAATIGPTLHLLLSNLSVASIVQATYYFGNSIYILYFVILTENFDQLKVKSSVFCRLQESPKVIAQQVIALSLPAIAFERYFKLQHCDKNCPFFTTIAFVIITWLLSTGFYLANTFCPTVLIPTNLPYCNHVFLAAPHAAIFSVSTLLILEVIGIVLFLVVLVQNHRRLRRFSSHNSLSSRLEIRQNLAVCKMLLPSVWLHAVIYLIITGNLIYRESLVLHYNQVLPISQKQLITSQYIDFCLTGVHMAGHPFLCLFMHKNLRRKFSKMLNVESFCTETENQIVDAVTENECNYRLELLEKLWDRTYEKRSKSKQ